MTVFCCSNGLRRRHDRGESFELTFDLSAPRTRHLAQLVGLRCYLLQINTTILIISNTNYLYSELS